MITWIIGRGGLLGSAIERRMEWSGEADQFLTSSQVPWSNPDEAGAALTADYLRFQQESESGPWRIIWAAGAATVSTPADQAQSELRPLQALLTVIRSSPPQGPGTFFLTSSAGGVYAGSQGPPFDTNTTPVPLSPYGELKLAQEALTQDLLANICTVVIGRFSNLYGPGQNVNKLQGLISRLAVAAITQQPISIFVPLDTIRDYIYVDDAAATTLRLTTQQRTETRDRSVAVIASGKPATVGQVIHTMRNVARRRIPVAYGSHPSAAAQALDLRLTPSSAVEAPTQLPEGMKAAYQDILARTQTPKAPAYQASPASAG